MINDPNVVSHKKIRQNFIIIRTITRVDTKLEWEGRESFFENWKKVP